MVRETKRPWTVRRVARDVRKKQLDSALNSAFQEQPACLRGKLSEVRRYPAPKLPVQARHVPGRRSDA